MTLQDLLEERDSLIEDSILAIDQRSDFIETIKNLVIELDSCDDGEHSDILESLCDVVEYTIGIQDELNDIEEALDEIDDEIEAWGEDD